MKNKRVTALSVILLSLNTQTQSKHVIGVYSFFGGNETKLFKEKAEMSELCRIQPRAAELQAGVILSKMHLSVKDDARIL